MSEMQAIKPIEPQKSRHEYWVCYEHKGHRGIHAKLPVRSLIQDSVTSCQRWLERVNQAAGPMAVPYAIWVQEYEDGALTKTGENLCAEVASSESEDSTSEPGSGKKRRSITSAASA